MTRRRSTADGGVPSRGREPADRSRARRALRTSAWGAARGALRRWLDGHRRARLALRLLASHLLIWAAAAVALEAHGHRRIPDGTRWDAIVVAGCRVEDDGAPSLALQRRTRRAVELWRARRAPRIVLTGGLGRHPPTEALAAARFARGLGVPSDALVLEERSTSTEENARYAAEIIGRRRVLVVTDTYHVLRAERVFGRYFSEAVAVGSVPQLGTRVRGALREVPALVFYWAAGRL